MAKAFYELLRQLWIGSASNLSPLDFKIIFSGFMKQVKIFIILVLW
jgi:hypothetical protein